MSDELKEQKETAATTGADTTSAPDNIISETDKETSVKKLKIDMPCLFGCLVCVVFFVIGLISKAILSNPNLVLDIAADIYVVFAALLCNVFGGLAGVLALVGIGINIGGIFFKTKLVSLYNYILVGLACVWVFLLVLINSTV